MATPSASGASTPSLGPSAPQVPPLYQSSVYTLPDLDALDSVIEGRSPGFIYARDGHPNARHLAGQLTALEGASWSVVCGSGMAALSAALLTAVGQSDHIVASDSLYGRTTQLLTKELARIGVRTALVDARDPRRVRSALEKSTKVMLVETVSNPLLAVADIPALAEVAHEHGCLLVVDNTFATPVLCRPLELGADLVIESLTKMIGGHSDVTLGVVCGAADLLDRLAQVVTIWGLASNPFDCWLTSRGLATLTLRMRAAAANAQALADWLEDRPNIVRVLYPGRPDHPDHATACRVLKGGFGNMLSFELDGGRDAVNRFMRRATGIPFSPSLGGTETTCSHPASTSHRYASPADKEHMGISDGLIRLSVGIEELAHIQRELAKGLG